MRGIAKAVVVGDRQYDNVTEASRETGVTRQTIKRAADSGKPIKSLGVEAWWVDDQVEEWPIENVSSDPAPVPMPTPMEDTDESIPAGMTKAQLQWTANVLLCSAHQLIEDANELNERAKKIEESQP